MNPIIREPRVGEDIEIEFERKGESDVIAEIDQRSAGVANAVTPTQLQGPVTLSVVIPALNEEDGIAEIIRRVLDVQSALKDSGVEHLELIVVDDGSTDRTAEIAATFDSVTVIRHPRNLGYGAAIKNGFAQAHGELLAFLDADGTYPPEYFATLCRVALTDGAQVVVGSRRSGGDSQMPLVRQVGNLVWSNMVSVIGNHRVADPASGMRVIRHSALAQLSPLPDGLNFTPVMSTRAVHEGLKVVEIPISYRERVGRSKLSIVRDGMRFLTTILSTAMEYNPVRVFGFIALAAFAVAAAIGVDLVVQRAQGVTTLGPWGVFELFTALVLTVSGVSIFSFGAMFNYLVSLFHRRPIRQGLFGRPFFSPSLDRYFGWLGVVSCLGGLTLGAMSLTLALSGWEVTRLWFWMLVSALLGTIGVQLVISWVVMRVLERLSDGMREAA